MLMTKAQLIRLQQELLEAGYYSGKVDGIWGPLSEKAHRRYVADMKETAKAELAVDCAPSRRMAWGKKVSETFRDRVQWIADSLQLPADGEDWLMACMAWESGETFSASIRNGAGSGAVGLIQFMPRTALALGTSTEALARLTPEDQLNYVYKYFLPYKGRIQSLADMYMAILWPAAIGKGLDSPLWSAESHPITYRQNAGLDIDKNFTITKREAAEKVQRTLHRGMLTEYFG